MQLSLEGVSLQQAASAGIGVLRAGEASQWCERRAKTYDERDEHMCLNKVCPAIC